MTETGAVKEWKQARNASPEAWRKHHKQKMRSSKSKPKPGDDIDVESQEEFSDGEHDEMEFGTKPKNQDPKKVREKKANRPRKRRKPQNTENYLERDI
jgi:hypothetical protein